MNKTKIIKNICKFFYIVSIILILFSAMYIFKYYFDQYQSKKERNLLNEIALDENEVAENTNGENSLPNETVPVKPERIAKLEKLQEKNTDIIGWIEIENTNINYPVVQGSDNDYYLDHNYEKKYSVNGAIFLDKNYVWNPPSSNLLIYGHHTTFADLLNYKKKSFYAEHPTIRFTTNDEDAHYEIISAFYSKVYYQSDTNVFRYYYFINAKNEKEYNSYVENAKKASIYDTGKTAKYGNQLLTLSTCSYHTEDGRFVVVAVKNK